MAVNDILNLLNVKCSPEQLDLKARLRDYGIGLKGYLESRMRAGTTHVDLSEAIKDATNASVESAFFSISSHSSGQDLARHLGAWIESGAVPLLTTNLFLQGHDAWHHQVVRGIDEEGRVMLLNPIERVSPHKLIPLLSSPPFIIIPREHVHQKLTEIICKEGGSSALEMIDQLCQELDATAPWGQYSVGTQISKAFNDMIRSRKDGKYQPFDGLIIPFGGMAGVTLFFHSQSLAAAAVKHLSPPQSFNLPAYEGKTTLIYTSLAHPLKAKE